jgi:hypothetical protein
MQIGKMRDLDRMIIALWPAFLVAGLLEMLIWACIDPADLHWLGQPVTWSRQSIYSVSFLALWTGCALSAWLTQRLGANAPQSPDKPSTTRPSPE